MSYLIRKRIVTVIPCLLLILFDLNAQNLDERIRQRVEFARFQETNIWGDPLVCTQALYNFYENRMFQPVWSKDKDVDELIEIIRMADFHGLQKEDYHYIKIKNIWEKHKDKFIGMQVVADFDVLLSGHTHGGQICLPGGAPVTLSAVLPRSLGSGPWRHHGMIGYTSTGTGSSVVPVRFNCPPEITLHELRRSPSRPAQ